MKITPLPTNAQSVAECFSQFKKEGPASIAHLIVACYWSYIGSQTNYSLERYSKELEQSLKTIEVILRPMSKLSVKKSPADYHGEIPPRNASKVETGQILSQFIALESRYPLPEARLVHQSDFLNTMLLHQASRVEVDKAFYEIQKTLVEDGWDFKYRLRLISFLNIVWQFRNHYQNEIFHFIVDLLIVEANLYKTYRKEPGHGIVTMDCLKWFVWNWGKEEEIKSAIKLSQSWRRELRKI